MNHVSTDTASPKETRAHEAALLGRSRDDASTIEDSRNDIISIDLDLSGLNASDALSTSGDGWTPEARSLFKKRVVKTGMDLYKESVGVAKRENMQAISEVHVGEAYRRILIRSSNKWLNKLSGIVGGTLVGCALGLWVSVLGGQPATVSLVGTLCIFATLGSGLTVYHVTE